MLCSLTWREKRSEVLLEWHLLKRSFFFGILYHLDKCFVWGLERNRSQVESKYLYAVLYAW